MDKNMKIAFIISSLGSGGAERVLTLIANELSKKHDIYIITLSNDESFYELDTKIKHIKLDLLKQSNNIFKGIINSIKRIFVLKKELKKIDAHINISFITQTNILSIIASKLNKQKIIIAERSVYYSETNTIFWRQLRRFIYLYANHLLTLTIDDAKNYDFLKNKSVIPNCIQFNKFSSMSNDNKENIILAVGRLHPVKQFDKLIKMYAQINSDYKLLIVGEGSERKKLESLINRLNLNNKIFLEGRKTNVFEYYNRAKIFVLTSKHEAFPNVILEAMSYGCAVVSFDCDYGPRTIIENNINGFLVKNEEEFKEKIELLMKNDEIRKKISKNAKERVKFFKCKKVMKQWEELIKNVSNKKK
jgi:GalNAc-alpha-(1->4)-GalNAc-alpha-(1->3)-diNAcBac-PP-undecaprenol alpha-1,4-N-acetyl-D-galactosaminyltransferase